ncbi:hypothetical protein [Botrimarina mediterranea]|uniref:hypothetical protein n=1 Tax=Botrimarina mediterranea TaxID=2528022 RepID=UPI0011A465FE|nr:hypothetical protein [Botrimarina mediterranea]
MLRRFDAPEAVQGVAVAPDSDEEAAFYAIANSSIGKYEKHSGKRIGEWKATEELPLRHLNAGIVRDGRLYCAQSNFPAWPEISSVEVFDTRSMTHVASHSFGIYEGSLTWIDWREDVQSPDGGAWWAGFAHYTERVNDNPHALSHAYTSLVKFDSNWRRLGGWVFPAEVLDRFSPHSTSGGGWGPDALLGVTGHDRPELYLLKLPQAGSTLRLVDTVRLPITGQAFCWDPSNPNVVYGIDRPKRQVVVCRVTTPSEKTKKSGEDSELRR